MDVQHGIYVGVAESKYVSGINNLGDKAPALDPMPLEQALCTAYSSDAHFFTYFAVNTAKAVWPRCNKPLLAKLRASGGDLMTQVMVFDIDNPEHRPWDQYVPVDEWLNWFNGQFLANSPWAANYTALYSTKSGMRLVYTLDQAIPVDDAEGRHRWMTRALIGGGLPVDRACSDWTRCFRLPYVRREGHSTSASPFMRFYANWQNRLPLDMLGDLGRSEANDYIREIRDFEEPLPDLAEAKGLLSEYNPKTGRNVMAAWFKAAKKRLVGRDCYKALFNQEILASEGRRDTTLHSYVGQVISLLYGMDGISPTHIFALFLEALEGLDPDQDTPDWFAKCWDHIGRIWVREEARKEIEREQQAEDLEHQQDLIDTIIGGMQRWCKHPDLFRSKPLAQAFATRHLICTVGQTHHVMNANGYYDSMSVNSSSLIARIRILGMNGIIETQKETDKGLTDVDARTILNAHSCVVRGIEARPNIEGGYINRIDTSEAELMLPAYQLNPDIDPEFVPQVDAWLQRFFGPHYVEGCEWIAWALAFDEGPICALSLEGDSGIGKKLFVTGLSECLKVPALAKAQDMVDDYQYGLMSSPFLVVNEGWPKKKGGIHPADSFRYLVDGQPSMANRKFLAPVKVYNPVRIIFTANNTNVVTMLGGDRDLSPEDRDALSIRLKHFKLTDEAAHWFRQMGGMSFTARAGARWVEGDSGQPSDYLVAKHFMYLHSIRGHRVSGRRFLVDGNTDQALMYEFRTGSGTSPLVIESLIKMMEHVSPNWRLPIHDNRLFASTSMVLDFFRANLSQPTGQRITSNQVTNAFKSLQPGKAQGSGNGSYIIDGTKARWWELDPELLLSVARRDGRKSDRLEGLVEERRRLNMTSQVPAVWS